MFTHCFASPRRSCLPLRSSETHVALLLVEPFNLLSASAPFDLLVVTLLAIGKPDRLLAESVVLLANHHVDVRPYKTADVRDLLLLLRHYFVTHSAYILCFTRAVKASSIAPQAASTRGLRNTSRCVSRWLSKRAWCLACPSMHCTAAGLQEKGSQSDWMGQVGKPPLRETEGGRGI